jgi:hypothetical protein
MTDLTIRSTEVADRIGDVLQVLADTKAPLEDRGAAYAIAQQVRLKLDRALKANRDDIIVGMERAELKALGPLSIRSSAVDPRYPCNDRENWEDATVQDGLNALRHDERTRAYVRVVPAHFELDVDALVADLQLGVQAAIDLYREANRHGWRTEEARRLSLAVREGRGAA